jgi:predicted AAA+ superfamily ATPase
MTIQRDLFAKIQPYLTSPEAIVITGMRRTGKTTLLRQIAEHLQSKNQLFIDLENPINRKFFESEDYEQILNNLRFLGLDTTKPSSVFLDEVQFLRQLPSVVKYLADHYKIKFFLSGSSSFYLKNLFTESLAGRKFLFELFPLTFGEFLRFKAPQLELNSPKYTNAILEKLGNYYTEYLLYGGFPGVVAKNSKAEKELALQDIFSSYFQLEIQQLGDFRKVNVIRDLMLLLMERAGSKIDLSKLSGELGVARETLGNYLAFLEQTYFIKLIRPFTTSRDIEIRSQPKLYICDTGLINCFTKLSAGAIFENAVFLNLRARGTLNYYQRKNGAEIDFILNKKIALEVKATAQGQDVKKLAKLAKELSLPKYFVITKKPVDLPKVIPGFLLEHSPELFTN